MSGWVITFFILTLGAGLMGFTGFSDFAGAFAQAARVLTVVFVLMLAVSILRSIVFYRHPRRVPLP